MTNAKAGAGGLKAGSNQILSRRDIIGRALTALVALATSAKSDGAVDLILRLKMAWLRRNRRRG